MPQFWPFQPPEAPAEKIGFLGPIIGWFREFIEMVYYAGCLHGAMVASFVWIGIIAVIIIIRQASKYHKERELTVGLISIVVALLLWYANRLPSGITPSPVPSKPTPVLPKIPWRPFKAGDVSPA